MTSQTIIRRLRRDNAAPCHRARPRDTRKTRHGGLERDEVRHATSAPSRSRRRAPRGRGGRTESPTSTPHPSSRRARSRRTSRAQRASVEIQKESPDHRALQFQDITRQKLERLHKQRSGRAESRSICRRDARSAATRPVPRRQGSRRARCSRGAAARGARGRWKSAREVGAQARGTRRTGNRRRQESGDSDEVIFAPPSRCCAPAKPGEDSLIGMYTLQLVILLLKAQGVALDPAIAVANESRSLLL